MPVDMVIRKTTDQRPCHRLFNYEPINFDPQYGSSRVNDLKIGPTQSGYLSQWILLIEGFNKSLALYLQNQGAFCRLNFKKGSKNSFDVDHSAKKGNIQSPKDLKLS
jgi:hypothetical protein